MSLVVRRARRWGALAPLLVLASCTTLAVPHRTAPSTEPGTAQLDLRVGDADRTYLLHVPPHPPRRFGFAGQYPLLIVLHGSGASGQTIRQISHLDSLADRAGMVVVYPDATRNWLGLQSDWNAGACCGGAARNQVDDVGFLRALVAHVETGLRVDRRRVFVAGFSDGARMAYRAGCELSDEVAAMGIVAGSLVTANCRPRRPVPLIAFHGTEDSEVSFTDPAFSTSARGDPPVSILVPPAVRFWASNNGCREASVASVSPNVVRATYAGCAANVVFYSVKGGGHAWPGGEPDGDDGDTPTNEVSASAEMMRFFLRHPLR